MTNTASRERHTLRTVHDAIARRVDFDCNNTLTGRGGISGTLGSRMPEAWNEQFRKDVLADDAFVVRSYATPIAWFADGKWTVPDVKYSPTTSRHQSAVRRGIANV